MFKEARALPLACLCAVGAIAPASASANEADNVTYVVAPGDTLYGIAGRYLVTTQAARQIQRINKVRNPRRLNIDRTLIIPRQLLRHNPAELRVAAFSGPVRIAGNAPTVGTALREGQTIETGPNGFISFSSQFGGRISLPSNTSARLIKARRYVLGNTLDVDFAVSRGRANAISPTLEGQDRLRMRTPLAVTAVRGTEFRVAYDAQVGEFSLTEVTEGEVRVAAAGQERAAPAGFGVSSTPSGVSEPEELLPAPAVLNPGAVQTGADLEFALEPVGGAVGYRVQLARDAGFIDVISEQVESDESVVLPGIANGRFFVRAQPIAASGLEGKSQSYSFIRKRLGVSGTAVEAPDYNGFNFAWVPEGGEHATFAFQLWSEDDPQRLLVDEMGLTMTKVTLTDLPPGKYVWRVAAVEAGLDQGFLKVWAAPQSLIVAE
ncbi:FecR family protein [Qipengyuania sp. ASV99]|uniref:FecR family protein n=1 Tax=Qipengyuania sp. ASV99 TaxID=3399681 RepID=UPI003A4C81AD